jgi:trehalose-phosphatase
MEDRAVVENDAPNGRTPRPPLLTAHAALFLDFDGTLAAIAPRPDAVVVEATLVPLLKRLHRALDGAVALVSGRPIAELDRFVEPLRLPAAGVHGAERRGADGRLQSSLLVVPRALRRRAERLVRLDAGLQLEDKQVALALHWRRAPQFGDLCLRALLSAARTHPDWRVLHGKSVAEVKPSGVSKGHAVQAFCAELPFLQRVGKINGDYGELDWMPVRYMHRTLARKRLPGLYRAGRVALVTPLRDGMNLVAKEYVAAQDPDDPGVLVLSRFTGAAEQLKHAALLVNPYDTGGTAEVVQRALRMPREERILRHRALFAQVREHDVHWWRRSFLQALAEAQRAGS